MALAFAAPEPEPVDEERQRPRPGRATTERVRRELLERQFTAAVIADCVRACTKKEKGSVLTVRMLRGMLARLYRLAPSAAQLRLAVGTAHGELTLGRVSNDDRREAFHGINARDRANYPTTLFTIWDKQLKSERLEIGRLQQLLDLHRIARGEQETDKARRYLRENDWSQWPPHDRIIWERTYVHGETSPTIARVTDIPRPTVRYRLELHQQRSNVAGFIQLGK